MSTNIRHGNLANDITLALPVATGTEAGHVVPVGDAGLLGYTVTPVATEAGPNAVGLEEGQASVRLLPAQIVIEVEGTFDTGDTVFGTQAGDGSVTYGATGDYVVGHAVGPNLVYLGTGHTPADAG